MIDNSTFNSEHYDRAVVSFKNDRRILIKYGNVIRMKLTRYYVLHNDVLIYYKNNSCEKSKSSLSLLGCSCERDRSKISKLKWSLKVMTQKKNKPFWLHPMHDDELGLLERYLRFVSEGRFNNDHLILRLLNEPVTSNKEKCTSIFSSNLNFVSSNLNACLHKNEEATNSNRSKMEGSQIEPLIVASQVQEKINDCNVERQLEPSHCKELVGEVSNNDACNKGKEEDYVSAEMEKIPPPPPLPPTQINEYIITLGQMSQNNMFTNQANVSVQHNASNYSQVFKNLDANLSSLGNGRLNTTNAGGNMGAFGMNDVVDGCAIEKDISAIMYPQDIFLGDSPYLDIEADLHFSSDEECAHNKNEKLESVRQQYPFYSPRGYFIPNIYAEEMLPQGAKGCSQVSENGQMNRGESSNFSETQEVVRGHGLKASSGLNINHISSYKLCYQPSSSPDVQNNYLSPLNQNELCEGVEDTGDDHKDLPQNIGQNNLSSSTLNNIFFPESQKNYTESINASFFSHKFDANVQLDECKRRSQSMNRYQVSQVETVQKYLTYNSANARRDKQLDLSSVGDLEDRENISSEDEEQAPSSHLEIKQLAFCAGATRFFFEDAVSGSNDEKENNEQKNNSNRQSLRNSRLGAIVDYSFDRKSLSDTDILEQQDFNFEQIVQEYPLKSVVNLQRIEHRVNQPEIIEIPAPKEEKEQIQLVMENEGNDLDDDGDNDDDSNAATANNVTHIIEKYKEQNYCDKNTTFFNSTSSNASVLNSGKGQILAKPTFHTKNSRSCILVQKSQNKNQPEQPEQGLKDDQNILKEQIYQEKIQKHDEQIQKKFVQKLAIDPEMCNSEYSKSESDIPRIRDKKEFYNKKGMNHYIVPKMEETLAYLELTDPINNRIPIEQCYEDGYYYLWSFQFENAHKIFKLYREENINLEYALLEHNLLKIIVTGSRELIASTETKFSEFLEYLLACEKDVQKKGDKSEIKCLQNISKLSIDLLKAELYLVRGLLQAFTNNKFQSFISFRNAYARYKKAKSRFDSPKDGLPIDIYTQSRFYFVSGLFHIGLSMIPNYFLKILSLLGVQPDKEFGFKCLDMCVKLNSIRSYYASLLLAIECIELNPNLENSIQIIKKMIRTLPQCPLFYWMAALLSWRYAKPDDALNLINKSLWNCGESLSEVAFYLKFEKGWFCISQLDWKSALIIFEEIAIMSMEIDSLDIRMLEDLAVSKKLPKDIASLMQPFIEKAKKLFKPKFKIILPHKCCLAALIACCYENLNMNKYMELWFLMTAYLNKKQNEGKTTVDEEITKLSAKYIMRKNKHLVKYEILYFVKEITKLRADMLDKMVEEISIHLEQEKSDGQFTKTALKNNPIKAIELGSTVFLSIVGGCLQQNFEVVYSVGNFLDLIAEYVPIDHSYLLHHSYHWLARCYIQQNEFVKASIALKKCLKYKKCEFSLENKSQRLLNEIAYSSS